MNPPPRPPAAAPSRFTPAITAGTAGWVALALGFFGLHLLMQERPQFVGEPSRAAKTALIQAAPRVVLRKVSDDVAAIQAAQPESSEITLKMRGHRDYRGLRTVVDMAGEIHTRHVLANPFDEPVFLLFKGPHPRAESEAGQTLLAGGLKLTASSPGQQENTREAWFWSGTVEARGAVTLDISYHASALKSVAYHLDGPSAEPVKHLRVEVQREDLPAMRFEGGDGPIAGGADRVVWERRDFLAPAAFSASIAESRNLYGSLLQLLEIGPVISLLFLLAVAAIILARQPLSAVQMLTICAGYAFYFPLMLYLSSRFSFPVALALALVVPGALLVNYARLLLGVRLGLFGGIVFLLLYQLFPTLAAFAGWNRGMVLLCLGMVTFAFLINLQNQALRKTAATAALALLCGATVVRADDVQVLVPGKIFAATAAPPALPALLAFDPAEYTIRHEAAYFHVEVRAPFQVLRASPEPVPLFAQPLHLQERKLDVAPPEIAQFATVANRLALLAQNSGTGALTITYRVPIENHEGRQRAQIPLLLGSSGRVRLDSTRADLVQSTGALWSKTAQEQRTVYDFGVAGEEALTVEWRAEDGGAPSPEAAREFYGIGITRVQHLTVISSDGSCAHFAEFELPAAQAEELRLRLPPKARLVSVSVNGVEATAPALEAQLCRLRLPARAPGQTAHRLSFRLGYPPVRLGFTGSVELALPEVFQTIGTLEWSVALPAGFEPQIVSSGLEVRKTPPDLSRFGDYGRILKAHPQSSLAKDLAPPGPVALHLRYRQAIPRNVAVKRGAEIKG